MMKFKMSKARKIVGLDLDGVIIDHTENKLLLARRFGFSISREETPSDLMKQKIPKETREEIEGVLYDDPVIGLTPDLMSGAKTGIRVLSKLGLPYYLISRRKTKDTAIALLEKKKLWPFYFNEANTFFVKSPEDKNEKAKELGVSIYVDDQPSVIEKLTDVPAKFLFDYLKVYRERADYKKIHSWEEFLENIKIL